MKSFIFVDDDKESDTYGQFCVIISETESYGRFDTFREAVEFLEKLLTQAGSSFIVTTS